MGAYSITTVNGKTLPASLFAERTGYPLALVWRALEAATLMGLLEPDPSRLKATELGRRFQNQLLERVLAPRRASRQGVTPHVQFEATGVLR